MPKKANRISTKENKNYNKIEQKLHTAFEWGLAVSHTSQNELFQI